MPDPKRSLKLWIHESTERFLNDCNSFMRNAMQKFQIQKDHAATLVFLNWAAPSAVRNSVLAAQTGFVYQLILGQPHASCQPCPTSRATCGCWRATNSRLSPTQAWTWIPLGCWPSGNWQVKGEVKGYPLALPPCQDVARPSPEALPP